MLQIVRSLVRSQMVSLEFFIDIKSFRSHYGPGVDSASNINEYHEYFLGVKRPVRKACNQPPSCVVTKSGNLNFLEPSGPLQAYNAISVPLPYTKSKPGFHKFLENSGPSGSVTGLIYISHTYLFIYLFTYFHTPWNRVLEKLTALKLVKKLPAFSRITRFITAVKCAGHLSLS